MKNNIVLLSFEKIVISNVIRKEVYAFEKNYSLDEKNAFEKNVCIPKEAYTFEKTAYIKKNSAFIRKKLRNLRKSYAFFEKHTV